MYAAMCIDTRIDMHIDMCIDICTDMPVCTSMYRITEICMDKCTDLHASVLIGMDHNMRVNMS